MPITGSLLRGHLGSTVYGSWKLLHDLKGSQKILNYEAWLDSFDLVSMI